MSYLLIIPGLIVLFLLIALFAKKEYHIRREIVINQPKQQVFNYLKMLKNQDNFSKWVMIDPAMQKNYRGTDGTVGFIYAWDGDKKAGKGEQELKKITEGERLDIEVRFERPFTSVAQTPFTTTAISESQTKVSWEMISRMNYPMNIMTLFVDKLLGKDMETSLVTLKGILER